MNIQVPNLIGNPLITPQRELQTRYRTLWQRVKDHQDKLEEEAWDEVWAELLETERQLLEYMDTQQLVTTRN